MGEAKPDDAATSAPGSKSSAMRKRPDMDERRQIIAEHIASLKAVLRRLLNKLH